MVHPIQPVERATRSLGHAAPFVGPSLARKRIWPELEPNRLAGCPLPAFHVERGARADRRPETAPLPAGLRVVDAAVQPLCVEAHRIGHTENNPPSVPENEEPLGLIPGVERHVLSEPERVELGLPGVVAPLPAPRTRDVAELREWLGVEGPPLWTVLAGRGG